MRPRFNQVLNTHVEKINHEKPTLPLNTSQRTKLLETSRPNSPSGEPGSCPTYLRRSSAVISAKPGTIHLNSRSGTIGWDTSIDSRWRSSVSSSIGNLGTQILNKSLKARSRMRGNAIKGRVVADATVRLEIYKELWSGTLPGYIRLISWNERDQEGGKDKWLRAVLRRLKEARRYGDIYNQWGAAGLIFMNWFKRTWLTGTTNKEWASIMNVSQEGNSWLHEEIARVFGDAAAAFLTTLTGMDGILKTILTRLGSIDQFKAVQSDEDLITTSTPSQIMCIRPDQLPIWTNEDDATSSLDTLLLMAARMAFLFPDLYTQGKDYGSRVFRRLADNLLKLMQADPGKDVEATWFHVNVEILQKLRDQVRLDLAEERLVGRAKVVVDSHSSLESIERHVIPQQLVEHALLFRTRCNSCGKEFEVGQSTRTRGIHVVLYVAGDVGLQEIIDGSVLPGKRWPLTL